MNIFRSLAGGFETLMDRGNDLTSMWGPFRRRLPPKDVKLRARFVTPYVAFNAFMVVFASLPALTLIFMLMGRNTWYPSVATGRLLLWPVVSYYASWLAHHFGFLLFYLAPALAVVCCTLSVVSWNLRAQRLQKETPSRELQAAMDDGIWPPPPANRR